METKTNKKTIILIANFLNIEKRENSFDGNLREINFNNKMDIAYIRCQFKRFLLNCKNSDLVIRTKRLEGYRMNLKEFNFKTLDDRNKLITNIDYCINHILQEGEHPMDINFEF